MEWYENWKARIEGRETDWFDERLKPIGISDRYNFFDYLAPDSGKMHAYFEPDHKGHIDIYYPSAITRDLQMYERITSRSQEVLPVTRKRFRPGMEEMGDGGRAAKYKLPKGSNSVLWIGKVMLARIRRKDETPVLIVTEGEFKAAIGDRLGLPILGIGGVHNTGQKNADGSDSGELLEELLHVIRTCKVRAVCLLFDSDLFDLGSGIEDGGDPAQRPRGTFYAAAKRWKERCELAQVDAWIAWPKPGPRKQGLDDLILDTIGPAPEELLQLEGYTPPANPLADWHWNDAMAAPSAAKIAKAMGWDLRHVFSHPETERKMTAKQAESRKVRVQRLQASINWIQSGKRICKSLIRQLRGKGGESRYFSTVKATTFSDLQLKAVFFLDSEVRFWQRHYERLKDFKSFKWGRQTFVIGQNGPEPENADVSVNLEILGNQLFRKNDRGGKALIGEFYFRALWHIRGDIEGYILECTSYRGDTDTVVLRSAEITNIHTFETRMLELGLGYMASAQEHKHAIKDAIKGAQHASSVTTLGWQTAGHWAWSNGIYDGKQFNPTDEMGFTKSGEDNYYIAAASVMTQTDQGYAPARMLRHIPRPGNTWTRWYQAAAVVYGRDRDSGLDRALVGMSFVCASLFADLVRERLGFFPILFLFGPPQMGKSTFATSLLSFFGQPLPRVNMEAGTTTIAGLQRVMARFRNVPVHLDEVSARVRPELLDLMKNIFDGIGGTQGVKTPGTETRTYPILSTAVASGQHLPGHDPALVRRCVIVEFGRRPAPSTTERDNMEALKAMERLGLTELVHQLLELRPEVERLWSMTFARFYKALLDLLVDIAGREGKPMTTTDSVIQAHAALYTPLAILAPRIDGGKLVTEADLVANAAAMIPIHREASTAADEGETFWHYLELATERHWIHGGGRDYLVQDGWIYLRFRRCHTAYQRVATRELGTNHLPEASMKAYLRQSKGYRGSERKRLQPGGDPYEVEVFDMDLIEFRPQDPVKPGTVAQPEPQTEEGGQTNA